MLFFLLFLNIIFQSFFSTKSTSGLNSIYIYRINILGILITSLLILNSINIKSLGSGVLLFSAFLQTSLSIQIIEFLILIIGAIVLISLMDNLVLFSNLQSSPLTSTTNDNATYQKDLTKKYNYLHYYPMIILFNLIGAFCLLSSFDLLFTYIAIELQSFSLYILSTLQKNSKNSTSAGLKYFLIGGFASSMILLGISLIYSSTGQTNFESLYMLNISNIWGISKNDLLFFIENFKNNSIGDNITNLNFIYNYATSLGAEGGFIFLLLGILIKLGAAPFHQWAPEVYDKVPTKVTIWIVLIPKLSLFTLLLELLLLINNDYNTNFFGSFTNIFSEGNTSSTEILSVLNPEYTNNLNSVNLKDNEWYLTKNFILLSSVVSLLIGSILGLSQIKIKRLLAFSAISHIGFMLLSLSIMTELSLEAFFFYLIQYTFTNLNVFLILLTLGILLHKLPELSNPLSNSSKLIGNASQEKADLNIIEFNNTEGLLNSNEEKDINKDDITYLTELKGIFVKNPILSLSLAVSLFSMAGVPPLLGFFAKQQILYSAIAEEYIFMSLIAISTSVISAYYYLNIINISHFENTPNNNTSNSNWVLIINILKQRLDKYIVLKPSNLVTLIISLITLSLLLFTIKPNLFLNSTHIIAINLFLGN